MFQIGDKIFYPLHGAGLVQNIEEKEILGEKKRYYILQFPLNNMTIMLPVDQAKKVGLRKIADRHSIKEIEMFLRQDEEASQQNWNQRFRENATMLKSGDIFQLAQVVKSLMIRNRQKGLSTGEKKMLDDAKLFLSSEIVLIQNIKYEQALQFIEDAIS